VLNDIGPEIAPVGLARIAAYVGEAPDRFKDLAEVAAYFRTIYLASARMRDDELIEMVKWSVKPAPGGGLTWKMDPAVRRPMRGGTAQQRFDLWVPFARILCPVLIVRGAESDILAPDTVTRMRAASIGAKVVEVPGVGHAPTLGEPAALAALSEFLGL
jgi:pimeloyl-ACP methyl ester carboxylesterase